MGDQDFSGAKKVYIAETGDTDFIHKAKIIEYIVIGDNNEIIDRGSLPVRVCSPFYHLFREIIKNKVDVVFGEPEGLESEVNDPES